MSAVTRTPQAGLDVRRLAIALAAVVAVALILVALSFGRIAVPGQATTPDAGAAPVVRDLGFDKAHDHGWSSTSGLKGTPAMTHDHGWSSVSSDAAAKGILVFDAGNGTGLYYTGIPYPAADPDAADGASNPNRGRFHR
jgi:hypothetical protein